MIERIIEFSARQRWLVIFLTGIAVLLALSSLRIIPLDAVPDLSDTQVIVYSRWDRSPDIIEDQVTYPIVTSLLGAPRVKSIRGFSDFGYSFVYIIFEDGTNPYWARSRVNEYLGKVMARLPQGVRTELGPDATSVGWVYQYALVDRSGRMNLSELRAFQDWSLRYWLQSVPGVAEVASVGGFEKQFQVIVDPRNLAARGLTLSRVMEAVRSSNNETGGRLIEMSGAEYMVRGRGYLGSEEDLRQTSVGLDGQGNPVLLGQVAQVSLGPNLRRGVSELDGQGEAVGGIVLMRSGENALEVIRRVKERLKELAPSLPEGLEVVTAYDRSDLILRAIETLRHQLVEEMIIVALVIVFFLWHFPSASVPLVTIPVSVLLAFIPMMLTRQTSNIMTLAGIAISIGVLVDGAVVEVENAYKRLQQWDAGGRKGDHRAVLLTALKEVAPSVFFSLLVIAVAFLPVFTLLDQEGRMFRPLAFSKTYVMGIAAILALTLNPAMRMLFTRVEPVTFRPAVLAGFVNSLLVGKYYEEEKHPVSRVLIRWYEPVCRWVLEHRRATLAGVGILVLSTIPVYMRLGSEFMPPLNEGAILYMPTSLPGLSVTEAKALLTKMDQVIRTVPEVERVFGKAGRAETATDPAPFSMMETTIILKPEHEWRARSRWYSDWPDFVKIPLRSVWPDRISFEDIVSELDEKMQFPGVSNAWTMPIKARIDMLSTGIRTPVGIKISGDNLAMIEQVALKAEALVRTVPGARSVYAERVTGGYFIDFDLRRDQLSRYNLSVSGMEEIIAGAIGGDTLTVVVDGRGRYPVSVRYARDWRDDLDDLQRVLVDIPSGGQVPLGLLCDLKVVSGPGMIRNENGLLTGYVYVDVAGRDIGGFVNDARAVLAKDLDLPQGVSLQWSGQFENMLRVQERLKVVVPVTIFLIFLLLYLNTRSVIKAGIVILAVPFSLIGAFWLLWALGYNLSIAVWVGLIALMGLDAETGVFMLLYLDQSFKDAVHRGTMCNNRDLKEAIVHGAVKRIRPKLMTVSTMFIGLVPVMWADGAGADVMKRIAAPMIGGIFTSFILELLVYPVLYYLWKSRELKLTVSQISC